MNYKLKFMPSVVNFLHECLYEQQINILKAINLVLIRGDIKLLKGYEDTYRLKIQNYRIIYKIDYKNFIITILYIGDKSKILSE